MQGKIIKGIAGFFYVNVEHEGIYTCKAKGVFRNNSVTPLVGDNVELEVLDKNEMTGNITAILPRRNELIRPASANVDQALVIFAAAEPEPNLNLLDRFLVTMQRQSVETIICFNKRDIVNENEIRLLEETYEKCGHRVLFASVRRRQGINKIREVLRGKTTVLAGPSGVGKSSLMNELQPEANMETGSISEKIKRGKQTTRHTELIRIEENTFLMDTPGFSSLYVNDMEKEELRHYFVEFTEYEDDCRFLSCSHIKEPGCGVKAALENGLISKIRYDNYVLLYEELQKKKKYK